MTLTKAQIDKINELALFNFEENIRLRDEWDVIHEDRFKLFGDGEALTKWQAYMKASEEYSIPFFNEQCCTRMVEQKTLIENDGFCTMSWRLEWDHHLINNVFTDGCKWANEHGAGIPIGENHD